MTYQELQAIRNEHSSYACDAKCPFVKNSADVGIGVIIDCDCVCSLSEKDYDEYLKQMEAEYEAAVGGVSSNASEGDDIF